MAACTALPGAAPEDAAPPAAVPPRTPPSIKNSGPRPVEEDRTLDLPLTAVDADGRPVRRLVSDLPEGARLDAATQH